ncbi:MAG: 2-ketoglutarate: oxidoreductase subunit gamma [Pseudomonadota bacterium]
MTRREDRIQSPTEGHFHQVVDCQWACPAHTPVPEYLRLIAAGRYAESWEINWWSNVFPGILGRVCDRPCEPACRRGRVDEEPVAICRMKRVAADLKGDISARLPKPPKKNGKRIACVGAGPASLTVARDLALEGYDITVFDSGRESGGMMRSQIPKFRLPDAVIDEECGYVEGLGVKVVLNHWVNSLAALRAEGWDAVFIGTSAPRGRDADLPGRQEAAEQIHVGIDWLSSLAFGHIESVGKRVIVLGGGNTAMDCCRSARRLGAEEVQVIVRSGFDEMKASPWEKDEALHEGIVIRNCMVPMAFEHAGGKLTGVTFEQVEVQFDAKGKRSLVPTGKLETVPCDQVLVAIGQENTFPWIERDIGLAFDKWDMPALNEQTLQSALPDVFFGGDAALGPKNIITAVAQGHQAAISIDLFLQGKDVVADRPAERVNLASQKMGIHEWAYDNDISEEDRQAMATRNLTEALKDIKLELELGFDVEKACSEAARCLNCDMATVFTAPACIECDSCVDICPTECITFTGDGDEAELRARLKAPAPNLEQPLYIADGLKTGRVMVKDENLCLHCGLCSERCPTSAWDMQKVEWLVPQAGDTLAAEGALVG